ncbi:MAG: MFS transporter [Pseudomonadota bacterium]|nr:MFS transporter [Pseudomonadota bacterium]
MPLAASNSTRSAWFALALVSIANFGNFYVYDSIGPVADLLQRERGFSDTQIGMLNAIYSLPNIALLLVGGWMVDRFGAGRMMAATAALCFCGALLTALGTGFPGMAAGRLVFGIGAETFNVATLASIVRWFSGRHLALAIGASLALGRAGAFAVDLSPTWIAGAYADGWQPPLLVAALFAGLSLAMALAYWRLDDGRDATHPRAATPAFAWRDLYRFGPGFWQLLALCMLWYAVIFAFRSTFSIKFFQHAHGLELAAAGAINGTVYLAALFATPFFGWLSDRSGRPAPLLAFGTLLLPLAVVTMMSAALPLWIGTVLIGISYSLVPAVLWPLASRLVPTARLGTAFAVLSVGLNVGIAAANLAAGHLNDAFGAGSANPAGYRPMMLLFAACGGAGFAFALRLWYLDRT